MKDELRDLLNPADDGRGFTDAVLFKASGALARRRAAAEAGADGAWSWLERWARPWVLAGALAVALLVMIPAFAPLRSGVAVADSDTEPTEVLLATEQPEVALTVVYPR